MHIEYNNKDSYDVLRPFMLDLDESYHQIIILYVYTLQPQKAAALRADWQNHRKVVLKVKEHAPTRSKESVHPELHLFGRFLQEHLSEYFHTRVYALPKSERFPEAQIEPCMSQSELSPEPQDELYPELTPKLLDQSDRQALRKLLASGYIRAHRQADNRADSHALSDLAYAFSKSRNKVSSFKKVLENFDTAIYSADRKFNAAYNKLFDEVIQAVEIFGAAPRAQVSITVTSELSRKNLLDGNTVLSYDNGKGLMLPESYNGLGMLNLIDLILEIKTCLTNFQSPPNDTEPAALNLLFIEEPEAYTHPQLQYIFIQNIRDLLNSACGEGGLQLQTIITTHSAHIVSRSGTANGGSFDNLRYFMRTDSAGVTSLDLRRFDPAVGHGITKPQSPAQARFYYLGKYLTLHFAEVFFTEKIILCEGDTERLLLPEFIKQIDDTNKPRGSVTPLSSQHLTVLPIGGAYAHIFANFLCQLGLKILIITDLDSVKSEITPKGNTVYKACRTKEGTHTSNACLKSFFNAYDQAKTSGQAKPLQILTKAKPQDCVFSPVGQDGWRSDPAGKVRLAFQTKENGYRARSFEDAFINVNRAKLNDPTLHFESFSNSTWQRLAAPAGFDPYDVAETLQDSKTTFALDILFNFYRDTPVKLAIPAYIREGLLWLRKD